MNLQRPLVIEKEIFVIISLYKLLFRRKLELYHTIRHLWDKPDLVLQVKKNPEAAFIKIL